LLRLPTGKLKEKRMKNPSYCYCFGDFNLPIEEPFQPPFSDAFTPTKKREGKCLFIFVF